MINTAISLCHVSSIFLSVNLREIWLDEAGSTQVGFCPLTAFSAFFPHFPPSLHRVYFFLESMYFVLLCFIYILFTVIFLLDKFIITKKRI